MSFSVGGSDVTVGLKVAWQIYQWGFVDENRADVRYKNFQNDIFNFRYLLERLNEALQNAQHRYQNRGPVLGVQPYEPLSEDFEIERQAIVGNFLATLTECETLLEENRHFRQRCSNVWENLHYNLSQQESRVDLLRRRLHFHSEKIRLVLDRLSIHLLTDIDAKVDDILAISEQNLQVSREILVEFNRFRASPLGQVAGHGVLDSTSSIDSHVVSPRIAQRLQERILIDAPPGAQLGAPLPQGFDALLQHFEQSNEGSDQTPEKYLQFLKARWLLARLKEGQEYHLARPGYYYKRAINQIEQAIASKIRQPGELISFDEAVLLDLPESCFRIWPSTSSARTVEYSQPHPLMVRANEEKVAVIDLATNEQSSSETVTVFKSSDENIRIVLQTTPSSTPEQKVVIPQHVSVKEDRLIPRYALPTLVNPCLEVAVFSRNEEMLYKFGSFENLCKFQAALMGYDVSHDQQSIRCQFNKDATALGGPEGEPTVGRIQLWQEPIVLPAGLAPDTEHGRLMVVAPASASDTAPSRRDSLSPSLATTSTIHATVDGWEADRIKLPSLVIFALLADNKKGSKYAVIYIDLEPGMWIDPSLCKCHNNYDGCANLVLKSKIKKTFSVRVLYSDVNPNGTLNPNTFNIFPLRLPHGPEFARVTSKSTEFLLLNFKHEGLAGKRRFHRELSYRFMVRDQQLKDQRDFEKTMRLRQDQPQKRHASVLSGRVATGKEQGSIRSLTTPTATSWHDSTYGGSVSSSSTDPRPNSTGEGYESVSRFGTMSPDHEDAGSARTDSTIRASGLKSSPRGKAPMTYDRRSDPNRRVEYDPTSFGDDHLKPQSEFQMSKRFVKEKKSLWRR